MSDDAAAEQAPDTGGLAMDLAMEEARADPGLRGDVAAFLRNQNSLVDIQKHHLLKLFLLSLWEKRFSVFLRAATAVIGIAVATGAGMMVWDAAHSRGLIIEPFAVPSDMAARGLTSQVLATQMLDKLSALQDSTDSSRAPASYVNNWGDNIQVEIPQTGVSIGELQRFLKSWLGHDTHISGEVYRTSNGAGTGIAVTARVGAQSGATVTGAEADLDSLIQQAAENVYRVTQPYRYANRLDRNRDPVGIEDRRARASAIYEELIAGDDPQERAWALNGMGSQVAARSQDTRGAIAWYRKAVAVWPDFSVGYFAAGFQYRFIDSREAELTAFRNASRLNHAAEVPDVHPRLLGTVRMAADTQIAMLTGDYAEAARLNKAVVDLRVIFANQSYRAAEAYALWALALQHDPGAMRAYKRELGRPISGNTVFMVQGYAVLGDWRRILAVEAALPLQVRDRVYAGKIAFSLGPLALARAHTGDIKGAEGLIAKSPLDCDGCLLARAEIAEMQGQTARADEWFARAQAHAPSTPFAYYEWGRALLGRRLPDAAIQKFILANQKGPKFADPLEGWGEALMAKNQSHLALAKFAQAEKFAPNWKRLHLKWAEALTYTGNKGQAAKHFAKAATL